MANCKEIYKDIEGYENMYRISNYGNILSLPRIKRNQSGNYQTKRKILKKHYNTNGYQQAFLYKNGDRKVITIHKLVLQNFISSKPRGTNVVANHLDGNKSNNYMENLEWTTSRENNLHALRIGLRKTYGLTVVDLWNKIEILEKSIRSIAKEIGCSHATVSRFIRKEKKARRWHCE